MLGITCLLALLLGSNAQAQSNAIDDPFAGVEEMIVTGGSTAALLAHALQQQLGATAALKQQHAGLAHCAQAAAMAAAAASASSPGAAPLTHVDSSSSTTTMGSTSSNSGSSSPTEGAGADALLLLSACAEVQRREPPQSSSPQSSARKVSHIFPRISSDPGERRSVSRRQPSVVVIDLRQEVLDGFRGLGLGTEQGCVDEWPLEVITAGCRSCVWRRWNVCCCCCCCFFGVSRGPWCKLRVGLRRGLHTAVWAIRPNGQNQEVCHHISLDLLSRPR